MNSGWSIWVLEYGHVLHEYPNSAVVYLEHNTGTRTLPFGYVYLRGNGRHVMVDVGYDDTAGGGALAARFGITDWQPPSVVLAEVGVRPEDIDTVLVTHAHFDHFGNVEAFPNATFYLQERELTQWVWAAALPASHGVVTTGIDPDDLLRALELAKSGRLKLLDGDVADILPGIDLWAAYDTHTWGSMFVEIRAGRADSDDEGHFVLAGDNVYTYENVDGVDGDGIIRPVGLGIDNVKGVLTIARMRDMVGGRSRQIIPVHEQRLAETFPSRRSAHGLNVTEVHRRDGDPSYVS